MMEYLYGLAAFIILSTLLYYFVQKRRQNKALNHDNRFRYLDTDEDVIVYDCVDCTCTTYYLKTKAGIKRTFCYDDFVWVYIFEQKLITSRTFGLTLMAHTKDGRRYKLMNSSGNGRKVMRSFNTVMDIIQEKNPDCLIGESEENHKAYLSIIKH